MSDVTHGKAVTVASVEPGRVFRIANGLTEFVKDGDKQIFRVVGVDHTERRITVDKAVLNLDQNARVRIRARSCEGFTLALKE